MIHPVDLKLYGLNFPEERIKSRRSRSVQEILDRIRSINSEPLIVPREPRDRVVGICRNFAMFFCSVLREKGIPARCRCGFATYLSNGWFEDHWICEYWNEKQQSWIRVDPMMGEAQMKNCGIKKEETDPLNLPGESFFCGAAVWKLYRQGLVSGRLCGFFFEEGEYGEWYIRGNMLRDFFALNKIEYTYQERSKLMSRDYEPSGKDLIFLDKIADLTLKADEKFTELKDFFEKMEKRKKWPIIYQSLAGKN